MGKKATDMGLVPDGKKKELKKHSASIQCSNTLSLLQRKVSNALLYYAYNDLMKKEEHEITVKQLCGLIGYQGNNHAVIKEALKGLISTVIEWNLIDQGTGTESWTASSILASVSLNGPLCHYAYSPRMKQLLYSPSMFGKIDLVIQSRFRSSYGLALYENCIRYRGLLYTKWFEMALFKKLMGVPEDKYPIFRDFKRRVLDKAIEEVNMYSDMTVVSELEKEGRKVKKIRFSLKDRAKKIRLGQPSIQVINEHPLISRLRETFQLSLTQIETVMGMYPQGVIEDKIRLIENSNAYANKKIKNVAAYFLSALKNDYQLADKSPTQEVALVQKIELRNQEEEVKTWMRIVEGLRTKYFNYREEVINTAIAEMDETAKDSFLQKFYEHASLAIYTVLKVQRDKYTYDTVLEAPSIKAQLRPFALRELDFIQMPSIEEFMSDMDEEMREAWQKLKAYDPDHDLLRL